jgi:DNA-binding transcriptional MerR regulator
MSSRNIGGALTMSAYAALAESNRPSDPEALTGEIRRLHDTGLTARDIATALRLPPDRVLNMLAADGALLPQVAGLSETDRELSLVERRIVELQHGLRLLQVERAALMQQLQLETAHD